MFHTLLLVVFVQGTLFYSENKRGGVKLIVIVIHRIVLLGGQRVALILGAQHQFDIVFGKSLIGQ